MWILTLCLYILIPSGHSLTRIAYLAIHALTLSSFFVTLWQAGFVNSFNFRRLLAILIIILSIILSSMKSNANLTFDKHIAGALGFLEMLIAIYIIDFLRYDKGLIKFLYRINLIISLVFICLYFTPYAFNTRWADSLNLGYSNPNETAIYLLINLSILTIYFDKNQRQIVKLTIFFCGAFLLYLLYLTRSRTCLIAAIFILSYRFFALNWKLPKWIIRAIQLFPLFFLFLYVSLYENRQYIDTVFLGKELFSGREAYYAYVLSDLKNSWWVGDISNHYFQNAHNGPLAIMLGSGVMGYLAYFWFTNTTLLTYHSKIRTYSQTIALIVIFAFFIHASAEAALFVSGAHYTILSATIYWILKGADSQDVGTAPTQ